jgi:methionyl aminopeptidase
MILVRPGLAYRQIGDIIQRHADQHGFSVVRTYCGHGIGRLFHSTPLIPHYSSE